MSKIATGIFKSVAAKRQSALGTIATTGSAQYMRRVTSTLDLNITSFQSNEINVSQQVKDMRHGVKSVAGTISGELSVGGYQGPMESICRQVVQAAITTGAIVTVTSAVTSGAAGTYTRSAGSYLTDGFKIGDIITSTGWATTGAPNNNHYAIITALTATVMTVLFIDGVAMGSKVAGDSVTIAQVGKKTWMPVSSQTRDYWTIEHLFSDIAQSEVFTDCVFTDMNVALPSSGMATVGFPVLGLGMTTSVSQYFVTPTAAPSGALEAAPNGIVLVNGAVVGIITSLTIDVKGNYSLPGGVIGSQVDPDIFPGKIAVTGTMAILFQDATQRDLFIAETEISIVALLTGSNIAAPAFTCFVMPRVKYTDAKKDDGEKGLTLTMAYTALENVNGGAAVSSLDTTLSIQDSAFA